jgi:CheY-like chemotaxis protein
MSRPASLAKTVLVGEDDSWTQILLAELLVDEGHRVMRAASGMQALQLARSHPRMPSCSTSCGVQLRPGCLQGSRSAFPAGGGNHSPLDPYHDGPTPVSSLQQPQLVDLATTPNLPDLRLRHPSSPSALGGAVSPSVRGGRPTSTIPSAIRTG